MRSLVRHLIGTVAALTLAHATLAAAPPIPWLSGPAPLDTGKAVSSQGHVIVQFATIPTPSERAALKDSGITLLTALGENAWFASCANSKKALPARPALKAISGIHTEWKLHPTLARNEAPSYALVPNPYSSARNKSTDDPWYAVYVVFHRDVDAASSGTVEIMVHGGIVHGVTRLANAVTAEMQGAEISRLAAEDSVQWIEPALPAMNAQNDQARLLTQVDAVQASPYNLNGAGVGVLVYDDGVGDATHPDFGGRLTPRDSGPATTHSTHVAGIVGGNGANSASHGGTALQWRGMAPGVTLESYSFSGAGGDIPLFTDPGDIESDYKDAISHHGVALANNSIGVNVYLNTDLPCSILGDYGVTSALIDAIVNGGSGTPFRVVWAAGNERAGGACALSYGTIAPPSGAKNHISVGAVNSNTDSVANFSSWGPTDDGRIKPDMTAPGSQTNGDLGITSTAPGGGYTSLRGTSMAAPVVTGICALLLQDFRLRFPNFNGTGQDPRNSTLKAILIHSAVDDGPIGPDFQYGYGSVRAKAAVDLLRSGQFLEQSITDGDVITYVITIAPGDTELKATLVWDDVPAAPNLSTVLVNDLDIVAEAPSGTLHYPYTLDPSNPGAPAVQTGPDHLNNVEQVRVSAPELGAWKLRVIGHSVPEGPQAFSLAASPILLTCASAGQISFSRVSYPCDSTVSIVVSDCQLNTDPLVAETTVARLFSTSDSNGRVVTLTETGPSTAVFRGTFTISGTVGPDALFVSDGDTITAAYDDADDGAGHQTTVFAAATVDCAPPMLSNTQTETTATTAHISFDTSEPTRSTVEYGENCAARNLSSREDRFLTSHTHSLLGLVPDTEYRFIVTATDPAGNFGADTQQDLCYTFTTKSRVDFFTTPSVAGTTLAHTRLTLIPIDGGSRYSAFRTRNVYYLPTDPSGGETIPMADDDSAKIALGKSSSVVLYGTSYNQMWIGSNGNLDLIQADTSPESSALLHFRDPRVSALFRDLDPSALTGGGTISWKQAADHLAVTWQDVPEFSIKGSSNTFQLRLFFSGVVDITWLNLSAPSALAGISEGNGVNVDFAPSDFAAYPAPGLVLIPVGDRKIDAGARLSFTVGADSNVAPPTLSAAHLPFGATFVDHGGGIGEFSWATNGLNDAGIYNGIQFTASDGVNSASETITIQVGPDPNSPPTASDVRIVPDEPNTAGNLTAHYVYSDPEGQAESGTRIRWFRNGVAVAGLDNQSNVRASSLTPGDTWFFSVRPSDGSNLGDGTRSQTVTVRDVMDLDRSGHIDAVDLQLLTNALLGVSSNPRADVDADGKVDAVDLQLLILTILS